MALQGVQGNLLELLQSADKTVQDFISSLQPGDSLRGRVVGILADENKAIINFKGYNLVSQLPQGMNIQKGDIINVLVSQLNNRIFMKIDQSGIGKGVDPQQLTTGSNDLQQLIGTLNTIKIPVNEQNIFIAQKLVDYHLSVTAENFADINKSLSQYLSTRGIDSNLFIVENAAAAKNLLISNFFKLGMELEKNADSFKDMARILDNRGQLDSISQDPTLNDIAVKTLNVIKTMDAASLAAPGTSLAIDDDSVILTIQTQQSVQTQQPVQAQNIRQNSGISQSLGSVAENVRAIVNEAIKEGVISHEQAPSIINSLNTADNNTAQSAQTAALGNAILSVKPGGVIELKYNGLPQIIDNMTDGMGGRNQAIDDLNAIFSNKLINSTQADNSPARAALQQETAGLLPPDIGVSITQIRQTYEAISKNIISPESPSLQDNIKQTAGLLDTMSVGLDKISAQAGNTVSSSAKNSAVNSSSNPVMRDLKTSVLKMADAVKSAQESIAASIGTEKTNAASDDYEGYQSIMKVFMGKIDNLALIKTTGLTQTGSKPVQADLPVDVESTIEALAFLKSRDIPAKNSFIDIMSGYFKSDMKLSSGIESLSSAIDNFSSMAKNIVTNQPQIKAIMQTNADIKRNIQDISIKTSDQSLKGNIVEAQLRTFIEKSGLNLENRLLNQLDDQPLQTAQNASQASAKASGDKAGLAQLIDKDNLKSNILKLTNEVQAIDNSKLSLTQQNTIRQMRDAANDILTNLNALQFMNHKPVSYDMVYTQVPVFFNNKLFNGELQVWYRKGAIKEDLRNNTPVNLVFMLNTSNLGPVKIHMTVYKNEVECTVKAENEKAKQVLMRGKNDFLDGLDSMKYNVKAFNVQVDDGDAGSSPASGEGYINIGRINLQA